MSPVVDLSDLEAKADEVAAVMKALANPRRLLILCHLAEVGTASVNSIALLQQPMLTAFEIEPTRWSKAANHTST